MEDKGPSYTTKLATLLERMYMFIHVFTFKKIAIICKNGNFKDCVSTLFDPFLWFIPADNIKTRHRFDVTMTS